MKKAIVVVGLAGMVFLSACAEDFYFRDLFFARSDARYLEKVKAQPLAFQIAAGEDAAAWQRARTVLTKYGKSMGGDGNLRKPSAHVLEMSPGDGKNRLNGTCETGSGYIYRISREPSEGGVSYTVSTCGWTPDYSYDDTEYGLFGHTPKRYAQVMAYFITSGKLRTGAFWHTW